jgi:polar amino acid transport system substrate-binding protein
MVLITFFPSCAALKTEGPKRTKIRVVTDATWPPFELVNDNSRAIEGFDIDLMKAIAQKAGFEVEFINVAFDTLLSDMAQCRYDGAISSIVVTLYRQKSMNFSDSYFAAGQIVTVRIDNKDITGKDKLAGKTVGAQTSTTGAIETNKIQEAILKNYDDIGLAFQDLMNGQIDAVIADNYLSLAFVGHNQGRLKTVGPVFTAEYYAIAVCNKNPELLNKINKGLKAAKAEGLLEKLMEKWLKIKI